MCVLLRDAAVGTTAAAVPQFLAGPSLPLSSSPLLLLLLCCCCCCSHDLMRVSPKHDVSVVVLSYAVRAFFHKI